MMLLQKSLLIYNNLINGNQQVIKTLSKLVRTSETTRLLILNKINKIKQLIFENDQYQNEWFAGLVDSNGSLLISKKGYMSLEITMSIYDEKTLFQIK